jgi:hypothetical protein
MSYPSVDALQRVLVESVFSYAKDRKKAAGRALGTLVEIITYYALKGWGFRENVAIERPLPEFGNPDITHNVEFSLHPILRQMAIPLQTYTLPLTAAKLRRVLDDLGFDHGDLIVKAAEVMSKGGVLRNACTFGESRTAFCIASIDESQASQHRITVSVLSKHPFAIFECKRVGIEEGMKKGPQTIEKAKQGAYVARTLSSLQKIRLRDGALGGVVHRADGALYHRPYAQLMEEVIASTDPALLRDFVLTVGVVSNHGNWFTADDHNKELKVLAQSYDWLLFLTDLGLAEFVSQLLLEPAPELQPAREAFLASYGPEAVGNRFTKVKMDARADIILRNYFTAHAAEIEAWFNIITPKRVTLTTLKNELTTLNAKNWQRILSA